MIDALDQGEYVHVIGKGKNQTDIKVRLHTLNDPEKETIFENCEFHAISRQGKYFTLRHWKGRTEHCLSAKCICMECSTRI